MLKKVTFLISATAVSLAAVAQDGKENPFSFEGSYIGDMYYNTLGGLKTGGGFMGMGNIAVGFDTGKARWWKGGSFYINGESIHGKSLTENYLGDLQVASNIDAGNHNCLHELWFHQEFSFRREGSGLSFTVGLQDLNAEFMVSEGGGEFVNSSFGTPSVIALGIPVPIFPLTGLGVTICWDITSRWAVQGALFDGVQTDFEDNPYNMHWRLGRDDGILAMGEVHFDGRYKLGAYYHSKENNYGFHASVDQPVCDRVGVFAQAVIAPKSKNTNNYYIGLGANLHGVFSKKRRDTLGLAVAHAGLHDAAHKHETVLEFYYKYRFNDNFAIQPDIQYVISPSGTDEKLPNALAGILRLCINF